MKPNDSIINIFAYGCSTITGIDVSRCSRLGQLDMSNCALTSLDITNCPDLTKLSVANNAISSLDLSNNTKLTELYLQYNNLSRVDVSKCPALKVLDVGANKLSSINVRNCTVLERMSVAQNSGITILDVSYNPELYRLLADHTGITSINLTKNTKLKELYLQNTSLTSSLDVTKNTALTTLNISSTTITSLDITQCTSLSSININNSHLNEFLISGTINNLIGQYVISSGVKGVVFYAKSKVKIVSVDEASKAWSNNETVTGATSNTDGFANTNKIISDSPAAAWCRAKGAAWYLPAIDELLEIFNNRTKLNSSLSTIAGTQLGTESYWSSTEYNDSAAWRCEKGVKYYTGYIKEVSYFKVRAVREL